MGVNDSVFNPKPGSGSGGTRELIFMSEAALNL